VVLFRATLDKAASPGDVAEAAALALTRETDGALTQAAIRAAGALGGVSVIRGDLAAPRLAEAAAALMAAPGPDDPVGAAALLVAAGLDAESAGAAIPPAGWRALKAVCEK
jgi:hypothetical protein